MHPAPPAWPALSHPSAPSQRGALRGQDEAWFVAVAKKKTARGILFFYPQTDELEFISKQKLQDYTKREVRIFLFC